MKTKMRLLSAVLLVVAVLAFASVVYAITITVDGNGSDWGANPPTSATDNDEGSIAQQGADIHYVYETADATKLYFRVDTYGNQTWQTVGGGDHWVMICLNTDNSTSTGVGGGSNCLGMSGIDYRIKLQGSGGSIALKTLQYCTGDGTNGTCSNVSGAVVDAAYATNVLEVSARLSDLGNLGSGCSSSSTVPVAVYWDGGDDDPDDHVTDTGPFTITITCPTAVTLSEMSARAETNSLPVLPFATAGLVGVGALGVVTLARRRK